MKTNYYESITFEVEKGLKKPQESYDLYGVKQIFQSLFKKRKEVTDPRKAEKFY